MIIRRDLVDYYYEDDEKLYSTGDDYIDDLLEKAFCDGYEYYQREFSLKDRFDEKRTQLTRDFIAKRLRNGRRTRDKMIDFAANNFGPNTKRLAGKQISGMNSEMRAIASDAQKLLPKKGKTSLSVRDNIKAIGEMITPEYSRRGKLKINPNFKGLTSL